MTKKVWGIPVGVTDAKTLVREMKLGTGDNPSSVRNPVRYQQTPTASPAYRAEKKLRAWMDTQPGQEIRFAGIPEVQAYVDNILSWPWHPWSTWPCRVQASDKPIPDYRSGIYLPLVPLALRELVVLHELGHHFARSAEDHGPLWLSAFSDLLATVISLPTREMFHTYLRAEGVNV